MVVFRLIQETWCKSTVHGCGHWFKRQSILCGFEQTLNPTEVVVGGQLDEHVVRLTCDKFKVLRVKQEWLRNGPSDVFMNFSSNETHAKLALPLPLRNLHSGSWRPMTSCETLWSGPLKWVAERSLDLYYGSVNGISARREMPTLDSSLTIFSSLGHHQTSEEGMVELGCHLWQEVCNQAWLKFCPLGHLFFTNSLKVTKQVRGDS